MSTRAIRRGSLTGAIAGMMMAMWSMLALAATGRGFWTPVNMIAHTIWRGAPLDGRFSAGALGLGLGVHMMISMMIGAMIFAIVDTLRLGRGAGILTAMAVTGVAWLGQLLLLPVVDKTASLAFTPWVLAAGHAVFAMTVAGALVVLPARSAKQLPRKRVSAVPAHI